MKKVLKWKCRRCGHEFPHAKDTAENGKKRLQHDTHCGPQLKVNAYDFIIEDSDE